LIKNHTFALVYRIIAFILAIAGFVSMSGMLRGVFNPGIMMYYTMQSNVVGIILFAVLLVKTIQGFKNHKNTGIKKNDLNSAHMAAITHPGYVPRLVMVVSIILLLTFLVYWIMLAPQMFTMTTSFNMWSFGNIAVHGITPLLVLGDYILFSPPKHLKYRDVYYVLIYPLLYVLFTSVAGLLGYVYYISPIDGLPVRFPYFFYDFDRIGAWGFVFIVGLCIFFLIISHIVYFLDRRRKV